MKSQQSLKLRILDYVFTFFEMPFRKNVKNVFSNYGDHGLTAVLCITLRGATVAKYRNHVN